jgi:hypothetical protein
MAGGAQLMRDDTAHTRGLARREDCHVDALRSEPSWQRKAVKNGRAEMAEHIAGMLPGRVRPAQRPVIVERHVDCANPVEWSLKVVLVEPVTT